MMTAFFTSGQVVDLILVLMALEGGWLMGYHQRTGRGLPVPAVLALLLPGAALLLALRAALTGGGWVWITFWLIVSLAIHLLDLRNRLR
ncbi:hypothetical protein [Ectothiorhodospira mobilis]|uniref:hypothetical protein n=1 Tax=Ectothiorhodospira mobilis TaxID=195064 RepID=UPI001EE81868|nr:hypothetical protein [Ectothiorhodospira mobilis]MCG5535205.1 hypothetical protein [Ectothiorhodospira mobilis]